MSTREEVAVELFLGGYNCAQAVLGAFCEDEGLNLNTALKLASGLGGGVRCGEICGAVSGAILSIGLKCGFYVEKDFEQKGYCNKKSYEFIEKFTEEKGSALCRDLLGVDIRCPDDHNAPLAREAHKTICPKARYLIWDRCASRGSPWPSARCPLCGQDPTQLTAGRNMCRLRARPF
jgi:C_GCAxxG_C_C family probable redox protein